MPFLPKPVWTTLKRHQIISSATNFIVPVLCSGWEWECPSFSSETFWFFLKCLLSSSLVTTVNNNRKLWTIWQNVKICLEYEDGCDSIHSNICIPPWHSQPEMEMTLLLWTGNMKTGLTPTFSFSPSFLTWIKSQLLFKIEEKAGLWVRMQRSAKYYIIAAFSTC